ncbi:hypothetical protein C21_04778 [Arenibacter sp. NBRC 103722]|nr:hypothetical protein C21_04778 [Arenibacter sp. NBRC 103722]
MDIFQSLANCLAGISVGAESITIGTETIFKFRHHNL